MLRTKKQENQNGHSVHHGNEQPKSGKSANFTDNRPVFATQRKMIKTINAEQPPRQMKPIDDFGKFNFDGSKYKKEKGGVDTGRKLPLYVIDKTTKNNATRQQAIRDISTENAKVGSFVKQQGYSSRRNSDGVDPFLLKIKEKYGRTGKKKNLHMTFQHHYSFEGYVTTVKDTGISDKKEEQKGRMYDVWSGKTGEVKDTTPGKYSNLHEQSDWKEMGSLAGKDEGESYDAYTKMAGEGSRWQCVRALGGKLTDQSMFYTANPKFKNEVIGIPFYKLWNTWKETFSKKYNIPDSEVVKKLLNKNFYNSKGKYIPVSYLKVWNLRDVDYNLDTHKRHGS